MQLHWKLMKGGALLALGNAGEQLFSLLRNIVLARLLSPHDFGAAATLAIAISAVETDERCRRRKVHDLGARREPIVGSRILARIFACQRRYCRRGNISSCRCSRLAVQDPRGRVGLSVGLLWFPSSEASRTSIRIAFSGKWSYRPSMGVSLAASCGGFGVPQLVLAWYLRSFEAMLWSQITQATIAVIGSHLVAGTDRIRLRFRSPILARLLTYGWPLMINGCNHVCRGPRATGS